MSVIWYHVFAVPAEEGSNQPGLCSKFRAAWVTIINRTYKGKQDMVIWRATDEF